MNGHICFSVSENCHNHFDSYGEICVHCNCCGRIDHKTMWKSRLELNERMLEEQLHFDLWDKNPDGRAVQERNVQSNIKYFTKRIEECKAEIAKEENT